MTSGFDKRSRFTKRKPFQVRRGDPLTLVTKGTVALVSEEVTSFRDDVIEAKRVPTDSIDPYHAGLNRSPGGIADYFDPGRRLAIQLENSGLITEADRLSSHSRGFIPDNGHPFTKVTHKVATSANSTSYRIYNLADSPNNYCEGVLPAVGAIYTSTDGSADLLFPAHQASAGRRIFRFDTGLSVSDLDDDLADFGTVAISKSAPAVPEVSTAAILGELIQSLPAFPGHALLRSLQGSSVGDEYLNVVFGLVPTHDDAKNLAKVLRSYSARLHQLRRDNGRPVRRKFALPTSQRGQILTSAQGQLLEGTTLSVGCGNGAFGFDLRRDVGTYSSATEISREFYVGTALFMRETQRNWFNGSFTYVLPELPGYYGRLEKYLVETDRLLGTQLDASSTWQLTPWSWLIDWFIDIGTQLDVMSVNFDDNLVLNYGYAMQETERSIVATVNYSRSVAGRKAVPLDWIKTSLTSSYKRRIRANPYGFVLQTDGEFWSPYRLAVLGALGLSRT